MATTRLIPMHKIKNQSIAYTVHERIDYAINPAKTLAEKPKDYDAFLKLMKEVG